MWAARRAGVDALGSLRAGAALVARGEFECVPPSRGSVRPVRATVSGLFACGDARQLIHRRLALLGAWLATALEGDDGSRGFAAS